MYFQRQLNIRQYNTILDHNNVNVSRLSNVVWIVKYCYYIFLIIYHLVHTRLYCRHCSTYTTLSSCRIGILMETVTADWFYKVIWQMPSWRQWTAAVYLSGLCLYIYRFCENELVLYICLVGVLKATVTMHWY